MSERPRLNLKPRDEAAVARAAEDRAKSGKAVRIAFLVLIAWPQSDLGFAFA